MNSVPASLRGPCLWRDRQEGDAYPGASRLPGRHHAWRRHLLDCGAGPSAMGWHSSGLLQGSQDSSEVQVQTDLVPGPPRHWAAPVSHSDTLEDLPFHRQTSCVLLCHVRGVPATSKQRWRRHGGPASTTKGHPSHLAWACGTRLWASPSAEGTAVGGSPPGSTPRRRMLCPEGPHRSLACCLAVRPGVPEPWAGASSSGTLSSS